MYSIIVDLIPELPQLPFQNGVGAYEGVVAHSTDNNGDTATGERNWETGTFNNAFVHFFIDDTQILQVAPTDYKAYGAGPNANPHYLHVELCQVVNDGTDAAKAKFTEAYNRYVWLLATLLWNKRLGVSPQTLWSHYRVTHELGGTSHEDPIAYLQSWGKTWDNVTNDVAYLYNAYANPQPEGLTADDANYIIDRWVGHEYEQSSDADKFLRHRLANVLRKLSGQEET